MEQIIKRTPREKMKRRLPGEKITLTTFFKAKPPQRFLLCIWGIFLDRLEECYPSEGSIHERCSEIQVFLKFEQSTCKLQSMLSRLGYVGAWFAWVKFLRRLRRSRGSKYFLHGSICYVGHNFYLGCVCQIYFYMNQTFLRGSKIFSWVRLFLRGPILIY